MTATARAARLNTHLAHLAAEEARTRVIANWRQREIHTAIQAAHDAEAAWRDANERLQAATAAATSRLRPGKEAAA